MPVRNRVREVAPTATEISRSKCPTCRDVGYLPGDTDISEHNMMIRCPTCNIPSSVASRIVAVPKLHDNHNPLWQGPCAEGPLGGITQSMIVRFLSCRERFRLKYILGLEPADKWNKSLGYGNMWHVCEEALAGAAILKTEQFAVVQEQVWKEHLLKHTNEQLLRYPFQREEIEKWYCVCVVQFPEYVKYWADHPDVQNRTPLFQEKVFDVPYTLSSGRVVYIRGKFDSVDLIEGGIWLQENKTKGKVDKEQIERQLSFDLQTCVYLIALDHWLDHEQENNDSDWCKMQVKGIRYNIVKRDCPIKQHVGRQLKAGWKEGETTEHWMERLRTEYYGAEPENYFFRIRSEVSDKDVQVFRETCLDPLLETIASWYESVCGGEFIAPPMNYRTPFGVYSALEENGATEYDHFMNTNGGEAGLRRVETMFEELK